MMRGIHTLRRDQTTQVICCNPWSTRLCCYPSLIRKMKTYLEQEGKCGNQPHANIYLPDKNSSPRKTPASKKAEKKKRAKAPVKRRFKVRAIAWPKLANPTLPANLTFPTGPTPTVVNTMATSTQMLVTRPKTATTKSIPVTVYSLAQGKFKGIPYPASKSQEAPSSPVVTIPLRSINPKLQPLPHPCRPERTPNGQIQCQPLLTYLLKGHHDQSPLIMVKSQHPPLSKVKRQRRRPQLNRQLSPALRC